MDSTAKSLVPPRVQNLKRKREDEDEEGRPTQIDSAMVPPGLALDNNDLFCEKCSKIELDNIFKSADKITDKKGIWVANLCLKHITEHASTCTFCHLLSRMLTVKISYLAAPLLLKSIQL